MRQPAIFISHGGGPCFWLDDLMGRAFDGLKAYLSGLLASLPERPRAILIVSAHWEEKRVTLGAPKAPGMIFDYYGFPEHTYRLTYPAPGAPELAEQARAAGCDRRRDGAERRARLRSRRLRAHADRRARRDDSDSHSVFA
ncbi:class III extradiol ring-cleavage dioxygenase [Methylosinus sp. R-45379]|uniref:DODA-type extradiol aromatic ring-opening family dioxygenase n=1 Tax=Methylosinus sp. R-45379 TaxID=980563 RepID=UPI000B0072E1